MTRDKHPKDRAERLRLREKKDKTTKDGATSKVRRRIKAILKEKEATDEVSFTISNS